MSSQDERSIRDDLLRDARNVCRDLCCCCIVNEVFMQCMPTFVIITQFIVVILQTVGTFMKKWITINTSMSDVNSTSPNITDVGFNQTVVDNLQKAAFGILVITLVLIVVTCSRLCNGKNVNSEAMQRFCFIQIVPAADCVSGVLAFIGCMLVAKSEYEYGVSFYICLTASVIQILLLPIIFWLYMNIRNDYLRVRQDDKEHPPIPVGSEECTTLRVDLRPEFQIIH